MLSLLNPQSSDSPCLQPELLSAWVSGRGEGHSLLKKKKKIKLKCSICLGLILGALP